MPKNNDAQLMIIIIKFKEITQLTYIRNVFGGIDITKLMIEVPHEQRILGKLILHQKATSEAAVRS